MAALYPPLHLQGRGTVRRMVEGSCATLTRICRRNKEGPPVLRAAAQVSGLGPMGGKRANPAPSPANAKWLNEALMALRRSAFLAIADPTRLDYVIERQLRRNALRGDPQRPRRDHVDFALAEIGRPAAIVDGHGRALVGEHRPRAIAGPVLELGQSHHIREALADRRLDSRRAAHFP